MKDLEFIVTTFALAALATFVAGGIVLVRDSLNDETLDPPAPEPDAD